MGSELCPRAAGLSRCCCHNLRATVLVCACVQVSDPWRSPSRQTCALKQTCTPGRLAAFKKGWNWRFSGCRRHHSRGAQTWRLRVLCSKHKGRNPNTSRRTPASVASVAPSRLCTMTSAADVPECHTLPKCEKGTRAMSLSANCSGDMGKGAKHSQAMTQAAINQTAPLLSASFTLACYHSAASHGVHASIEVCTVRTD